MKYYVVGFIFDFKLKKVLLINKLNGKLNGIGGKVEGNEAYVTTMVREFQEETGMDVPETLWRVYCTTMARDGIVNFFTATVNFNSEIGLCSPEAEKIEWVDYRDLPENVIDNLTWLIPMALAKVPVLAHVTETKDEVT